MYILRTNVLTTAIGQEKIGLFDFAKGLDFPAEAE